MDGATTRLLEAAGRGQVGKVRAQIAADADLTAVDARGMSALALAVEGGHVQCVEALLAAGASAKGDERAHHPLLIAARAGDKKLFERLLVAELPVDGWLAEALVSHAAGEGDVALVERLVKALGVGPDALAGALCDAAGAGKLEAIERLVALGARVSSADEATVASNQPVHVAAQQGQAEALSWLLSRGAKADVPNEEGDRPIDLAAMGGHGACVERLIAAGALVSSKNAKGQTPLHLAALGGYGDVIKLLVDRGAKVDAVDDEKKTPLHTAAEFAGAGAVAPLIERGARPGALDGDKSTPLHLCAMSTGNVGPADQLEAAKALVAAGADLSAKNGKKKTPADLLPKSAPKALRDLLAAKKPSPAAKAKKGPGKSYRVYLWEEVTTYVSRGVKTITLPEGVDVDDYLEEHREELEAELAEMDVIKEKTLSTKTGLGADEVKG